MVLIKANSKDYNILSKGVQAKIMDELNTFTENYENNRIFFIDETNENGIIIRNFASVENGYEFIFYIFVIHICV